MSKIPHISKVNWILLSIVFLFIGIGYLEFFGMWHFTQEQINGLTLFGIAIALFALVLERNK